MFQEMGKGPRPERSGRGPQREWVLLESRRFRGCLTRPAEMHMRAVPRIAGPEHLRGAEATAALHEGPVIRVAAVDRSAVNGIHVERPPSIMPGARAMGSTRDLGHAKGVGVGQRQHSLEHIYAK